MAPILTDGLAVFAVSLLLGGFAFFGASRYVTYRDEYSVNDYQHAVVTALFGAVAWAVLALIPVVGTLVALVGWFGVIKVRYPGGWLKAGVTGVAAWAAAVVVLAALDLVGIGGFTALGVPGT